MDADVPETEPVPSRFSSRCQRPCPPTAVRVTSPVNPGGGWGLLLGVPIIEPKAMAWGTATMVWGTAILASRAARQNRFQAMVRMERSQHEQVFLPAKVSAIDKHSLPGNSATSPLSSLNPFSPQYGGALIKEDEAHQPVFAAADNLVRALPAGVSARKKESPCAAKPASLF